MTLPCQDYFKIIILDSEIKCITDKSLITMKPNQFFGKKHNAIVTKILVSLFLLASLTLNGQTPTNFSGKWEFDKARSDKEEAEDASFNGTILLEIKQNSETISFSITYLLPGNKVFTNPPVIFLVNGKVTADNSGSDPARKFVKWSQDKKILTTNFLMTATIDGVAQDFLTADTYKLSDDGKTLVIEELNKSKLNGEKTIKKVYKKKI
jgi:hypothetical protein